MKRFRFIASRASGSCRDSFEPAANIFLLSREIHRPPHPEDDVRWWWSTIQWTIKCSVCCWGHQTHMGKKEGVKSARIGNSKTIRAPAIDWRFSSPIRVNDYCELRWGEMICLSICRWMKMMIIVGGGRKTNRGLWLFTSSIERSRAFFRGLMMIPLNDLSIGRKADLSSVYNALQMLKRVLLGRRVLDHDFDLMRLWNVVKEWRWRHFS